VDGIPSLPGALAPVLSKLDPDVCLITGDYRFEDHGPCDTVYGLMREIVESTPSRDGIFAILGNHDIAEMAFGLEEIGIRMLVNEAVEIRRGDESIWIAGLDDPFDYRCADLEGTFALVPDGAFKVLMVHTPELYREAAAANTALYLCGHTHAGQIQLPALGCVRHNCPCPKELAHGHWRHGTMHGYTSAGVGCSALPVRYNCPPEIILIELRRA
jgi:predicted MPP superfamily phosphohydrolase